MRRLNANKMLLSKWTRIDPVAKRKHHIVVELIRNEEGIVTHVRLEAVIDKYEQLLPWRELQSEQRWHQGWK